MANVLRTSGAWKSVLSELAIISCHPERPSDIHQFFKAAQKEYELAKAKATQDTQNKIETLKKHLDRLEKSLDERSRRCRNDIDADIEITSFAIQLIKEQKGIIQRIFNSTRVRKYEEKLRRLKLKRKTFHLILQKELDRVRSNLDKAQKSFDLLVEDGCRESHSKVKLVERVLKSPELAGALAELELINSLSSLPENHYIINDVKLKINKAIYFDGEWLKSAQIDHVVVTPSSVFVIETKNWSKEFAQAGIYYDPYQQVKRASYLCYKFIGERYKLKARSIIAHKGSLPEKPSESFTKVLSIDKVKGYISWFKDKNATDQEVEDVARRLAS